MSVLGFMLIICPVVYDGAAGDVQFYTRLQGIRYFYDHIKGGRHKNNLLKPSYITDRDCSHVPNLSN